MATNICLRISDEQYEWIKKIAHYRSLLEQKDVTVSSLVREGIDASVTEKHLKELEIKIANLVGEK